MRKTLGALAVRWLPAGGLLLAFLALLPGGAGADAARLTVPALLREMSGRFATLRDYQVLVDSEAPDAKPKKRRYRLEFLRRENDRQTNMFLLKARSGRQEGDQILVRQDGVVRMRRDELFAPTVTLRRSDPRLQDAEGVPLWESDFGSMISRVAAACPHATAATIEELSPAQLAKLGMEDRQGAYRMEIDCADDPEHPRHWSLIVSRTTLMPLQYAVYRDGKLLQRQTFRRFRRDTGKKPSDFRL
jgi:hypothetical protein